MTKLSPAEINAALTDLPGWALDDGVLVKNFAFSDFAVALDFVNRVGAAAEKAQHHPDIDIRYNRVRLALVTHDAGGITPNDAAMAAEINRLTQ